MVANESLLKLPYECKVDTAIESSEELTTLTSLRNYLSEPMKEECLSVNSMKSLSNYLADTDESTNEEPLEVDTLATTSQCDNSATPSTSTGDSLIQVRQIPNASQWYNVHISDTSVHSSENGTPVTNDPSVSYRQGLPSTYSQHVPGTTAIRQSSHCNLFTNNTSTNNSIEIHDDNDRKQDDKYPNRSNGSSGKGPSNDQRMGVHEASSTLKKKITKHYQQVDAFKSVQHIQNVITKKKPSENVPKFYGRNQSSEIHRNNAPPLSSQWQHLQGSRVMVNNDGSKTKENRKNEYPQVKQLVYMVNIYIIIIYK